MAKKDKQKKTKLPINGGEIEVTNFFGFWSPGAGSYPMFNGEKITPKNVDNYKLYIRYEDEDVIFYTWYKKRKGNLYIGHYKKTGHLDWGEGLQDAVEEKEFKRSKK